MEVIVGKIVGGHGVGRQMGFPTLNVPYKGEARGVFAAKVEIDGRFYLAAVNVGSRPTFDDQEVLCEAFLLNFEEDLLLENLELKVHLLRKVRETQKFADITALRLQISKDVEQIKSWYNAGDLI